MIFLTIIIIIIAAFFFYFFVGNAPIARNITWGVNFSQMQAESLGLDWKEVYLSIINDLGAKNIKLHTQWDWVEGKRGEFYFDDIDWQISQAEKRGVKVIYVLGLKSGRWPECHSPQWINNLSESQQQAAVLNYIEKTVKRYKDNNTIIYWQVENEPFFGFGVCPSWYYKNKKFLEKEIELVKRLDPSRKVIVSDSGEQSSWFSVAKRADIVGTTMYRKVWVHLTDKWGFNTNLFLPPVTYWRKALLIKKIFKKKVICIELQAEPWVSKPFYDVPVEKQTKTMNLKLFKQNIEFAQKTGLDTFYFWGVEWWYWMKEKQNQPQFWDEAKGLFNK